MRIITVTEISNVYQGRIADKGYTWLILTYKERSGFWFNNLTCIYAQTVKTEGLTEERIKIIFERMLSEVKKMRRS